MPPKKKFLTARQKHWLFGLLATAGTFIAAKLPALRDMICQDVRPAPIIVPIRKMPEQPEPRQLRPPCPKGTEELKHACYFRLDDVRTPCGDDFEDPLGRGYCYTMLLRKPRSSAIEDAQ